jgi:hypothetical protein
VPRRNAAWKDTGRTILRRLAESVAGPVHTEPLGYGGNSDPTRWYVVYDRSAGWEVISPILVNDSGFEELKRACAALTDLVRESEVLHVNYRTGLHVTLATRLNTDERLRGFLKRLQRLEPGLYTLVSPSRLFGFDGCTYDLRSRNDYCLPLRESVMHAGRISLRRFARVHGNRYHSVNLTHAYDDIEKLEVRMHNGTAEFNKIAPWISLWMQIFSHSRYNWLGRGCYGSIFYAGDRRLWPGEAAGEDIIQLLQDEGIPLDREFEHILIRRRQELRPPWEAVLPRRVQSWAEAGFYDPRILRAPRQHVRG